MSHRWREDLLLSLLRRSVRHRTVMVSEYELRPSPRYGWGRPPHPMLADRLRKRQAESEAAVEALVAFGDDLRSIPGGRSTSGALSWDNDWWGGVDAMVLYAAMRDRNPARYVEIGSGYSTRFARRSISDHSLRTLITSIDPAPRADIDHLCDRILRSSLEDADLSLFSQLEAGDIVVMDGSHMAFMNSDSAVFFLEVLPQLPAGVLVAIDDVFLPWDYPPGWVDRWYGEQYLLASMLLAGAEEWTLRFPAFYLTQESELKDLFEPLWQHIRPAGGRFAMSFWMEKAG